MKTNEWNETNPFIYRREIINIWSIKLTLKKEKLNKFIEQIQE